MKRLQHVTPDILLLDVLMPGMDGFETCRRIKALETHLDIPVIFMTGLTDTVEKVKGFEAGGVDYLTKPVQYEEVLARVNAHLTNALLRRQLQEEKSRFQSLTEASFEGILIHQNGTILEANPAIEYMFGYQRDEIVGKHVLEFMAPDARPLMSERLHTYIDVPYETEALTKDGASLPIEIQARTLPYNGTEARVVSVRDLSWRKRLEEEKHALLRASMQDRYKFGDLIGKSPVMQDVYQAIARASDSEANVLISGESGTGKELAAHTIHEMSSRKAQNFVAVNCGAVPEPLFERELFGHRKGAFTGATNDQPGYFDLAHKGTLFLDEIGELSPTLQVKLLRVLEEREYRPVGEARKKTADVRIIAATNKNLNELRQQGKVRDDFFYRVRVILIDLPPLRERREDIPLLIDHFLKQYGTEKTCSAFPARIVEQLFAYDWPGNVRELQNELQRYLTEQRLEFLGNNSWSEAGRPYSWIDSGLGHTGLRKTLEKLEKHLITQTLQQHHGRTDKTAATLHIPLRTLQRKIQQYGIHVDATNDV